MRLNKKFFYWSTFSLVSCVVLFFACTSGSAAKSRPNYVYKDAPNAGIAAKINGQDITEAELIGESEQSIVDLQKQIYQIKMARLKEVMVEKFIGPDARAANMTVDEYVKKKLAKGKMDVPDKEYKDFVDKLIKGKRIQSEKDIETQPGMKEKIIEHLSGQKQDGFIDSYLAKATKSKPVEVYLKKPKFKIKQDIDLSRSPSFGDVKAKVTIIEYSDFQCPYCQKGAETLKEVKKAYKGKIRVVFKHFPLPFHKDALPASEASMCVHEQSSDKFWTFYGKVFENNQKLDAESLEKYAKESGADVKKFKECFDGKKYADLVRKDIELGEKLGVKSTPTYMINGEIVNGALPFEAFSEAIDEALEEANAG